MSKKTPFLIVINPRYALKIPNYIFVCNYDKFKSFTSEKKTTTPVCNFLFPREGLKRLKLVLLNNIYFFFQWICFSQGSVPILQIQVVHTARYCMCSMIQRTARDQDIILEFSKDHSSMFRSSSLVHAC